MTFLEFFQLAGSFNQERMYWNRMYAQRERVQERKRYVGTLRKGIISTSICKDQPFPGSYRVFLR
jgi:hypothetical protein